MIYFSTKYDDPLYWVQSYEKIEDQCEGMKNITTGFSNWADTYLSSCKSYKKKPHQTIRMKKWGRILLNEGKN